MYYFAFALLALSLLCALGGAAWAIRSLWPGTVPGPLKGKPRTDGQALRAGLPAIERINLFLTGGYVLASCFLLYALTTYDFSLVYVASYTDRFLPLFYRITAFWAGRGFHAVLGPFRGDLRRCPAHPL